MGEFPPRLWPLWFSLLICSSVNYGVMNGEGLERLIAQESVTFQSAIGWDLFSLRSDI